MQPVLVVFEDLHWLDTETQALLDSLVESLPTARLLLLVKALVGFQGRGFAGGVQPDFCHALLLEVLTFQ